MIALVHDNKLKIDRNLKIVSKSAHDGARGFLLLVHILLKTVIFNAERSNWLPFFVDAY